jgi:MFS family permease
MIIIVATFGQALSGQAPAIHIIGVLVVWRFIMGVGIGGDYPLSAVISSEFASTRIRGRMMTATFAAQGFGNFGISIFYPAEIAKALIELLLSCRPRLPRRRPRLQELHPRRLPHRPQQC